MQIEECRKILGKTEMTDEEIKELITDIEHFVSGFLDEFFKDEFVPDDV